MHHSGSMEPVFFIYAIFQKLKA